MRRKGLRHHRPIARRQGLTMVEVAISTLLVGLIAVGAMRAVGHVFQTRIAANTVHSGAALAQALLSEILQSRYEEEVSPVFGPETGEASTANLRADFDDVDDYHGWSSSPPRPKDSTAGLTGYDGWSRSVQVAWADPASPLASSASETSLKRITVTVTDPMGRQTLQTGFRSRWGAIEQVVAGDVTVRSYVGSELQIGGGIPLHTGTNVTNHAQDL